MKDPLSTCCYNKLYQDVKQLSKTGECFCKDLMTVFQQRAELELTYAKGLQKLAGKLMFPLNFTCVCGAAEVVTWVCFSFQITGKCLSARSHSGDTAAFRRAHQEEEACKNGDGGGGGVGGVAPCRDASPVFSLLSQFDGAIDRTGKLVTLNWNEQLKVKKKLSALTREHEALFNFVEENKQICTEKEKQKMLNRLTKSAEVQTQVDDEYFKINMEGHQMRLKLENTLKNCHQIVQELEKQRIEVLCNILNRYHLQMTSFGQTLKHGHRRIEQAVQRVDMDKDMRALVEQNRITTEDTTTEFLMADYFEEDSKSLMDKDRRRQAIRVKVQRLSDSITRARKDQEGLLMRTYSGNPSFSNQKNLEETEQQLDECSLKLDLLRATHYKLSAVLSELEGTPRPRHPVRNISIRRWKDKVTPRAPKALLTIEALRLQTHSFYPSRAEPGRCRALYSFTSQQEDQLSMREGDLLDVHTKGDAGWWFGGLNGKTGHFPSSYVEELPAPNQVQLPDSAADSGQS
uniref:Osteoclast-stimulating factor 1 n=1 Tax=Takifugu rubripes TaxID=31033 RepID=H2T5P4_TAKRU